MGSGFRNKVLGSILAEDDKASGYSGHSTISAISTFHKQVNCPTTYTQVATVQITTSKNVNIVYIVAMVVMAGRGGSGTTTIQIEEGGSEKATNTSTHNVNGGVELIIKEVVLTDVGQGVHDYDVNVKHSSATQKAYTIGAIAAFVVKNV